MLSPVTVIRRHPTLVLWGLLITALLIRLFALLSLRDTIYFDQLLYDEQLYHDWALAFLDQGAAAIHRYDQAPLPALMLAGLYGLLGSEPLFFRVLNIFFGTVTCYLIYRIGRRLGGQDVGLMACAIAAIYAPFILYSIVPLKTGLSVCLFGLVIMLTVEIPYRAKSSPRRTTKLLALGVALGLAAGTRPNVLILALLPPLFLFVGHGVRIRGVRHVLLGSLSFIFGLILILGPLLLLRHQAGGEYALSSPQLGRNLYYGNSPENSTPYYRPMPFASSVPGESSVHFIVEASRRAGDELSPSESSRFWVGEVVAFMREQPARWGAHMGLKVLALFNRFEAGDHYNIDFLGRFVPFFAIPLPGYGCIMILGLSGMLLTLRTSRTSRHLAAVFILYGISLVVFYLNGRYRLPLVVLLIPWAAFAMIEIYRVLRERQWSRLVPLVIMAVMFSFLSWLPIRGGSDLSGYYNSHALLLDRLGQKDEAIRYWEKSITSGGDYAAVARLFLAGRLYMMGKRELSYQLLEEIADNSHAAAVKYALLGDLMAHEGRLKEAVDNYERSLTVNSGQRRIRVELIRLYRQIPDSGDKVFHHYTELKRIERIFQAVAMESP